MLSRSLSAGPGDGGAPDGGGPTHDGPPRDGPTADLGFARVDLDRAARTGHPEVVYAAGKTPEQTVAILARLHAAHPERAVMATRCDDATLAAVRAAFGGGEDRGGAGDRGVARARAADGTGPLDVDDPSRTVLLGPLPTPAGTVVVVAAGTSDLPVAIEALRTARAHGADAELVTDVGVAGLHRLLAEVPRISAADVVVAVAGMEGALPSVLAGLVAAPLVAVPTSTGYGWSMEGLTAFAAMLVSCAPGVTAVGVDNGYGAGVAAARVARPLGLARAGAAGAGAAGTGGAGA